MNIPAPKKRVPGCTGKSPFKTHQQARDVAQRMRSKYEDGCHVEPYKCVHCGAFHVGNGVRKWARVKRRMLEEV